MCPMTHWCCLPWMQCSISRRRDVCMLFSDAPTWHLFRSSWGQCFSTMCGLHLVSHGQTACGDPAHSVIWLLEHDCFSASLQPTWFLLLLVPALCFYSRLHPWQRFQSNRKFGPAECLFPRALPAGWLLLCRYFKRLGWIDAPNLFIPWLLSLSLLLVTRVSFFFSFFLS